METAMLLTWRDGMGIINKMNNLMVLWDGSVCN